MILYYLWYKMEPLKQDLTNTPIKSWICKFHGINMGNPLAHFIYSKWENKTSQFISYQWKFCGRKSWCDKIPPCVASAPAPEDDQEGSQTQGCVRLCDQLSQERVQHSHRLPSLPLYLCCHCSPIVQWEVLLLQWWKHGRWRYLPVSGCGWTKQ